MAIRWNGHRKIPPLTRRQRRLRKMLAYACEHVPQIVVTSTSDSNHAYRSLHGQWSRNPLNWRAADLGTRDGSRAPKEKAQRLLFNHFPHSWVTELFGPLNGKNVSNGRAIALGEGTALENQHDSHVHVGI